MLILKPVGRGNWAPIQLDLPQWRSDIGLLNQTMTIALPGLPPRRYWIRAVLT